MKKVLIINDSFTIFQSLASCKGIRYYPTLKPLSYLGRGLRKLCLGLGVPVSFWFGDWKKLLKEVDTVIVFANMNLYALDYIHSKYNYLRLIYWYWNPVSRCVPPQSIPDEICEKWSFDPEDCERYNLQYNTTFYFDNMRLPEASLCRDIFFSGIDKGRGKALNELQKKFNEYGLTSHFHIVSNEGGNKVNRISYSKTLEYIAKSRAILDFVQENQRGLTLRPMEALFFSKKLITNNKNIISEDFYHPDNIFILGVDDFSYLREFLAKDYYPIPEKIIERYDILNWLKRFNTAGR